MKVKTVIVLILFASKFVLSQSATLLSLTAELYLNTTSTAGADFRMNAVSTVWAGPEVASTNYQNFYTWITNNYDVLPLFSDAYQSQPDDYDGYDFSGSGDYPDNGTFAYGLYKLYIDDQPSKYIYLDYRDDYLGYYPSVGGKHPIDLWIRYNATTRKYEYKNNTPPSFPWIPVNIGNTINIWTAKSVSGPSTGKFKPYPPDNFAINVKDEGYPILTWDHSSVTDDYWTGYKIYRAITDLWDDPRYYSLLDSVGQYVTEYHDQSVTFGGWDYAHYYVVAANTYIDSEPTEELTAALIHVPKKRNEIIMIIN